MTTTLANIEQHTATQTRVARKILVFSPDPDVAQSLKLLLEDRSEVTYETQLLGLRTRILNESPALLLIDLYPLPSDILKTIDILKTVRGAIPIVFLYVYRNWKPEVERAIREVSDTILYKPIDVETIASVISNSLSVKA